MIFLNPNFFFFMLIPLFILFYLIITNKKNINQIFSQKILEKLTIKRNYLGMFGKNILFFATLLLFIISLARPVLPKNDLLLKQIPYNFAILLDISNSMLATDIYPNRLEFAKKKIEEFLKVDFDAKISIYAFSDNLFLISPKTDDKETLLFLIKNFKPDHTFENSSDIFNAVKNIKEKNIIIFSDLDLDTKNLNILGKNLIFFKTSTTNGSPIKIDNRYLTDSFGNIIISKPNPNIPFVSDIKKLLPKRQKSFTFKLTEYKELYIYFLILAFILLFLTFFSIPKKAIFSMMTIFFLPIKSHALFFDFLDIYKANKAYKEKDFKTASRYFKKIALEKNSPASFFNYANSLYKEKKYNLALKEYQKVIAKDKNLRYKTFFNIANCYFKLKKYKKAYIFYNYAKEIHDNKKVRFNLSQTKKFLTKKDIVDLTKKSVSVKKREELIEGIKQKTFMIDLTKRERKSVSW